MDGGTGRKMTLKNEWGWTLQFDKGRLRRAGWNVVTSSMVPNDLARL